MVTNTPASVRDEKGSGPIALRIEATAKHVDDRIGLDQFALWWSASHQRLRAVLRSSGYAEADVEDALAEATERAWRRGIAFDEEANFRSWIFVVARNLLVDAQRGRSRTAELVDHAGTVASVEEVLEMRWQLERVLDRMSALTDEERATLLEPVPSRPGDRHEQIRVAVRRHRLRNRLKAGLEGVAAIVGIPTATLRRLRPVVRSPFGLTATATAAVLLPLMLVTLSPWRQVPGGGGPDGWALAAAPNPKAASTDPATALRGPALAGGPTRPARVTPAAPPTGSGTGGQTTGLALPALPPTPHGTVDHGTAIQITPPKPVPVKAQVSYDAQHRTPSAACPAPADGATACPRIDGDPQPYVRIEPVTPSPRPPSAPTP
ncbi:MAG TPA: sigma factor [Acidimicrobiales bacterium]|nr:sigma factor [Acidimicrobiales bacterium]